MTDFEKLIAELKNVREAIKQNSQRQIDCGKRIAGRPGPFRKSDDDELNAAIGYEKHLREKERGLVAEIAKAKSPGGSE